MFRGMNMKRIHLKDTKAVSPVIAVILMVAITVVLASVLYVYVNSLVDTTESVDMFGLMDVEIRDSPTGDYMRLKLIDGDPVNWTKYKIIITNESDPDDQATMLTLMGNMEIGYWMTFDQSNAPGFNGINYQETERYSLEVYHIQKNKRVYNQDLILCKVG
jgi:flagellin-like protein